MSFEHPHIPDLEKNCKWIDIKCVADLSVDSIGDVTPHSLWATSDRTTLFSKLCSVFISNAKKVYTKYIVHKVHTNTNVNIFVSIAVINSSMICTNLHLRLSIKHNFIYLRSIWSYKTSFIYVHQQEVFSFLHQNDFHQILCILLNCTIVLIWPRELHTLVYQEILSLVQYFPIHSLGSKECIG